MPLVLALLIAIMIPGCSGRASRDPGFVIVAIDQPPTTLDPRIGTSAYSERLFGLMFSSLMKRDDHGGTEPDLAESLENPDPLTYIFHLRSGVKFHDGRPFTARDVAYTFNSFNDGSIRTTRPGTYTAVKSVEATNARTVVIRLKEPFGSLLFNLTSEVFGIVPEGSGPDFGLHPIGTGPFEFVRYVPDSEVVIKRADSYFGPAPNIKGVIFKIIPEAIVEALELRKGSVDASLNILTPDMVEVLRKDSDLNVMTAVGTNYQYIAFNLKDPVFSDIRVREAIAYAIDRSRIIKYLWRDQVRPADSMIPPTSWAYEPNVKKYPYDPVKARQLLKESGHSDLSFTFQTSQDDTTRLLAAVLQQQFREVGIHMDIRTNEFATFYAEILKGNFQAYSLRWIGGNNDPNLLSTVFHSNMLPPNGQNRGHYSNPEVDRLIELARSETDVDKRRAAYQEIQRIVSEDLPYVSLWYFDNVCVYSKAIQGMKLFPAGGFEFLTSIRTKFPQM